MSTINRDLATLRRMLHLAQEWGKVEKLLPRTAYRSVAAAMEVAQAMRLTEPTFRLTAAAREFRAEVPATSLRD